MSPPPSHSPSKGVPERQRGRGMFVWLLANLLLNPINIPLRRSAFAARHCPPSKEIWVEAPYPITMSKIIIMGRAFHHSCKHDHG